jgi:hypothetical protein
MSYRSVAILCVLAGFAQSAAADRQKLVVVVARGSAVTSVSRSELKHCFMGDTISPAGVPLVPFNAEPRTAQRGGFDRAVLGMSPDEVGRFWVDRKVRGQSAAPRSLPSIAHVQKVVAKFPNAIGYVPADQLTAELQPVKVDGVAYTDSNYALFTE